MHNLKMQRGCQYWTGRYKLHGKDKTVALGIKIEGKRPARLKDKGDWKFEKSRMKAQLAMEQFLEDLNTRKSRERLAKEIYKIQFGGEEFPEYRLSDLFDFWCGMKTRSDGRIDTVKPQIERFVRFMKKNYPNVEFTYQVTSAQAKEFMESEAERGIAPSTYNNILKLMVSCFKGSGSNVFNKVERKVGTQIHRIPYTVEELRRIRNESESDPFLRPIIIVAMCTGMRLGDCCNLKWSDIDEEESIIRVKTSKTKTAVVIPIFDWLEEELNKHRGLSNSGYIFPHQRYKHMADPSYFTKQLRKILEKVGFGQPSSSYRLRKAKINNQSIKIRVQPFLDSLPQTKKTKRMINVFNSYIKGDTTDQIREKFGLSKSTISGYLNEIEEKAGVSFIRGKIRESKEFADGRKPVQVKRTDGSKRMASVRDFHAFRTTWVTLAIKAGVPLETVRLVTGHKTVQIVIENYYNPSQRDIRDTLKEVMPFSDSQKEVVS